MDVFSGRTFDRIPRWDQRNEDFRIRGLTLVTKPPRSYTWRVGVNLDQGREGACVGFAWAHELAARPRIVQGVTDDVARGIYLDAQRVDEWPGEGYEGTSVLAGAKVVQGRGHFTEYRWARDVDELRMAIGYAGPAVLGVDWHEGMIDPADGWIYPEGAIVGGHAILCYAVNIRGGYFRVWNSWGASWGEGGSAKLSFESMQQLLTENGEACIPMLRQKV